jgi:hypothetical protein
MLVDDTLESFLDAKVATSFFSETGTGAFPMVTVCDSSPYNCRCEGLYDPVVIESHIEMVLPYVCSAVLSWKDESGGWLRNNVPRLIDDVDIPKTKLRMQNFSDTVKCDNGELTKQMFVGKIQSESLTHLGLLGYLGYNQRQDIVRFCQVPTSFSMYM